MYKAKIIIKRRKSILDPEGKAVEKGAIHLGFNNIGEIRFNKLIELSINTSDRSQAEKEIDTFCSKLLANPIMEDYEFTLEEVK